MRVVVNVPKEGNILKDKKKISRLDRVRQFSSFIYFYYFLVFLLIYIQSRYVDFICYGKILYYTRIYHTIYYISFMTHMTVSICVINVLNCVFIIIHTYMYTILTVTIHTYIHTLIHTYIHTLIHTYIHTLTFLYTYIYIHA